MFGFYVYMGDVHAGICVRLQERSWMYDVVKIKGMEIFHF